MENKQMEYSFGMNEEITPKEFALLTTQVQSALSQILNFDVNNLPVKGRIKEEMESVFDQLEELHEKWRDCSLYKPRSPFNNWLIINYMKNIVKLGDAHNGLLIQFFAERRKN